MEKKTHRMSGTKRSQSVLSYCSPSNGVLLREITVQRATYVINGENDDTRSTRWKEAQCLVGGNSRGNAESMLACHRKSFSCSWCARWTMARKYSRANRTYPPSYLSATYIHCLAFYCCSSWETATGNDETESCQCFLSAFLSESPFSFFVTWEKGTGWEGAKMRTKVAFSAVAMHKFSPRSRAFGLKGNREAPSGIQESEHRWMRRGGMLFNIPFWSRPFSRSRVPTEPRKRKRVRECEGKRNALE